MTDSGSELKSSPANTLVAAMLLIMVAAAVYFPVFSQQVGNHDEIAWIKSVEPPSLHTANQIISWAQSRFSGIGYYAPLTALSIMTDLWIGDKFGNRDAVLKGTNLALHALNTLLVLLLMRAIGVPPWLAFAAAIIFCVHPLQVSSVAWIAERKNLLMASCFLGGMLCYHEYRKSSDRRWYLAVLGLYMLGLAAKPSAVALGPCLFITDWFLIDRTLTRQSALRVAPFIVIGLFWTGAAVATEGRMVDTPPLQDRLLMIPYKVTFMIGKFLAPTGLTHIYPPFSFDTASALSWGLATALAAALGIFLLLHWRGPIWATIWALGFYFLNLAPSLGIVPFNGMREFYVADHYQYVSIIGASLLAVLGVNRLLQRAGAKAARAIGAALLCLAILGLGSLSAQHLRIWSNAESLWTHVIANNPGSHTAHYNYGHYLDEHGRYPEAVREYRLALSANEQAYRAYNNLGIIMMKFGRLDTAIAYFRKCLEVNPLFGEPHLSLAKIYFFQEKFDQAEQHCRKAAELGSDCSPKGLKRAEQEKRQLKEQGR